MRYSHRQFIYGYGQENQNPTQPFLSYEMLYCSSLSRFLSTLSLLLLVVLKKPLGALPNLWTNYSVKPLQTKRTPSF